MPSVIRRLAVPVAATAALSGLFALGGPTASAQADSCQPENIVLRALGQGPNPVPESQDPKCIVLKTAGCQNLAETNSCVLGVVVTTDGRLGGPIARAVNKVCDTPEATSICYINP